MGQGQCKAGQTAIYAGGAACKDGQNAYSPGPQGAEGACTANGEVAGNDMGVGACDRNGTTPVGNKNGCVTGNLPH